MAITKRENTCCFSGHRPQGLPWGEDESASLCRQMKEKLREKIVAAMAGGTTTFLTGMARGIDLMAAEIVLSLGEEFPATRLECVIPFAGQSLSFPVKDQDRYRRIRQKAAAVTVLAPHYFPGCMEARNREMVRRSALLIAVYNGQGKGGTKNTLRLAAKEGLRVDRIDLMAMAEEFQMTLFFS